MKFVTQQIIYFKKPLYLKNKKILQNYKIFIETYGILNKTYSNAILICHALNASHHITGSYINSPKNSGWWNDMVGKKKPINTNYFFVIGINNLGSCFGSTGPLSINPLTKKKYGLNFPILTIENLVYIQSKVANILGIKKFAAITGCSIGGMQALSWSILYPDRLFHCIIIASTSKLSTQNIAFNEISRISIMSDPNFHHGNYHKYNVKPIRGLRIARMIGHMTYTNKICLQKKFGRKLYLIKKKQNFNYNINYKIESYLHHQANKFVKYFDANTYLLITRTLDYFNPAKKYNNNLTKTLKNTKSKYLIISFTTDCRFNTKQSLKIVKALINNKKIIKYSEINMKNGHDSFLINNNKYHNLIKKYYNKIIKNNFK